MTAASPAGAVTDLVVFALDDQRYALALAAVAGVVRMVDVAPLPKAPPIVSGVIDLRGELVPVLNVRRRFRRPEREAVAQDQLLIAHTRTRRVALAVDAVEDVLTRSAADVTAPETIVPGLEYVRGIVRLPDRGLIYIHDLDTFLSLEEEAALTAAQRP